MSGQVWSAWKDSWELRPSVRAPAEKLTEPLAGFLWRHRIVPWESALALHLFDHTGSGGQREGGRGGVQRAQGRAWLEREGIDSATQDSALQPSPACPPRERQHGGSGVLCRSYSVKGERVEYRWNRNVHVCTRAAQMPHFATISSLVRAHIANRRADGAWAVMAARPHTVAGDQAVQSGKARDRTAPNFHH